MMYELFSPQVWQRYWAELLFGTPASLCRVTSHNLQQFQQLQQRQQQEQKKRS